MKWLDTILVLFAAFLAVFWAAAFQGIRHLLGVQIDLLPPILVYAGLRSRLITVMLVSVCGGLWLDSLSANPLGVTVLPLLCVGMSTFVNRDLILREEIFARLIVGFLASLAAPVVSLLLLLTAGRQPLFGWGTLWQLFVMSVGGALVTPLFFELFDWLHRMLDPAQVSETSFRPDREIRRGR